MRGGHYIQVSRSEVVNYLHRKETLTIISVSISRNKTIFLLGNLTVRIDFLAPKSSFSFIIILNQLCFINEAYKIANTSASSQHVQNTSKVSK